VFEEVIGGEVIADVRFDPGQSSYQAQVDQAFADDPEVVYLGSGFEAAGAILQEWQRRGYGGQWLFSGELIVPEIASLTEQGVMIGDGVGRAALGSYDMEGEAYALYAPRFEAVAGYAPAPGLYDAYLFDAYTLLGLATVKAGTTDGPAVCAAVPEVLNPPGTECYSFTTCSALLEGGEDINYEGVSSSLDVNDEGNLSNPTFAEWAIIDGQWTEMGQVEFDEALREGYQNLP
jgi:branched-chain amino acid transport system substrate-binding protein